MERNYEIDSDYIFDVLEEEEERLMDELIEMLPEKPRYLFFRYLAVKNTKENIKSKIA